MHHDDDSAYDRERYDDAEAFVNTLIFLVERQIGLLLNHRARQLPTLSDREFLPLLEEVVKPVEEYLSPERLQELWEYACMLYHDKRVALDPNVKFKQSRAQMQQCLLKARPFVAELQAKQQSKKNRRK